MNAVTVIAFTPPVTHQASGLLLCRHLVRLSRHAQRVAVVLKNALSCTYVLIRHVHLTLSPVKLKTLANKLILCQYRV